MFMRSTLSPLEDVLKSRFAIYEKQAERIAEIIDLYGRKKRGAQLLDFDDLLSLWLELLEEHGIVLDNLGVGTAYDSSDAAYSAVDNIVVQWSVARPVFTTKHIINGFVAETHHG